MLALLLSLFADPVRLDDISLDLARAMDGRVVVSTFLCEKPSYTFSGATIIGAADRGDGIERTAVVDGDRLDLDMGMRVTIFGVLRVIDHEAAFVNGVFVPGWVEIRVEGNE